MARLDRKKLAVIHLVKKELRLTDDEYRTILKQVAGVKSAKDLDEPGFRKLMNYLVRAKQYRLNSLGMTLKQKMFIQSLARDLGWNRQELDQFIQKYYHCEKADELSRKEAIKAIESLKNVLKHARLKDY